MHLPVGVVDVSRALFEWIAPPAGVWQGQFTKLRVPNLYNLRLDPPGEWIRHSSWATHAMRTSQEPLLAAYV